MVFGIACVAGIAVICYLAAPRHSTRQEAYNEGKARGIMLAELGYIKSSLNDIKAEQKALSGKVSELAVKQAMMERDLKTAFARIDENQQEIRQYYNKIGGRT